MSTFRAILVICAVPVLGFLVSWTIIWDLFDGAGLFEPVQMSVLCAFTESTDPDVAAFCDTIHPVIILGLACIGAIVLGLLVPALFRLAARLVGANRRLMAAVFPPMTFIGLVLVAALLFVHVGILAAGFFYAQLFWSDIDYGFFVAIFTVIAFASAGAVTVAALGMFRSGAIAVIGARAEAGRFPRLHALIQSAAATLSARRPDHVVLALDDRFFASSGKVGLIGEDRVLDGQTLCISLPLLRVLSEPELMAIIGHELAHFSGEDTEYSRKFAPVYNGLSEAVAAVQTGDRNYPDVFALPGRVILESMLSAFAGNAARASRERELIADRLGAQVASKTDSAYALLKTTIVADFWADEEVGVIERQWTGLTARNISRNFVEAVRLGLDRTNLSEKLQDALNEQVAHPVDNHPTTLARIQAQGLSVDALLEPSEILRRMKLDKTASDTLGNMEEIEEKLSTVLHEAWAALDLTDVEASSDEEVIDAILDGNGSPKADLQLCKAPSVIVISGLLAHLLKVDGPVGGDAIQATESLAAETVPAFDHAHFRECCRESEALPALDRLLEAARAALTEVGQAAFLELLQDVAQALPNGSTARSEVLERARAALQTGR